METIYKMLLGGGIAVGTGLTVWYVTRPKKSGLKVTGPSTASVDSTADYTVYGPANTEVTLNVIGDNGQGIQHTCITCSCANPNAVVGVTFGEAGTYYLSAEGDDLGSNTLTVVVS